MAHQVHSLRVVTISNIFFENSTCTRLFFELAEKRLSADTINFAASSLSVSQGQTLIDTVNNILAMKVDMVVIVGKILHSRVALMNIMCLKQLSVEVMVCSPTTLIPKYIESVGVKVEHNLLKASNWCDEANMLRIQLERQDIKYFPFLREYTMLYGLNKHILNSLNKEIIVMHQSYQPRRGNHQLRSR